MTPNTKNYKSMRSRMMIRLLPMLLLAIIVMAVFSFAIARSRLMSEYDNQVRAVASSTRHVLELIDGGYDMLDQLLETEMAEGIMTFKSLYEASEKPVDLKAIKAAMGDTYDLIIIDETTTIIDTTIQPSLNFNFRTFDEELGEKIDALRLENTIAHERIRTNVGTGLINKFTYLSADDHKVLLEIVYTAPGFENLVSILDPVARMKGISDVYDIVDAIHIYDRYGYEYSHGGDVYTPTDTSLALVQRALSETSFIEPLENGTRHVFYLEDTKPRPLSHHDRVVAISFNTNSFDTTQRTLIMIVIFGGVLTLFIFAVILYKEINNITKPIKALAQGAEAVAKGNYTVQLPITGTDETAYLTTIFNQMITTVDDHYQDIAMQFKTTLYAMGDGVVVTDIDGVVRLVNPAAKTLLEQSEDALIGKSFTSMVGMDSKHLAQGNSHGTYEYQRKDGSILPIAYNQSRIKDSGYVFVLRDMSDHYEKLDYIEYLSYQDPLTGLFNRRAFDRATEALKSRPILPTSLILIDVNGLKLVNDAFGHQAGDGLIKAVAKVLNRCIDDAKTCFRIGGDEFAVLMTAAQEDKALETIKQIQEETLKLPSNPVSLSVSIGSATLTEENTTIESVFLQAEDQMYRHKISESFSVYKSLIEKTLNQFFEDSPGEKDHAVRVRDLSTTMAKALDLDSHRIETLEWAAYCHDIGKVNSLEATTKTHNIEDRHAEKGYQIMKAVTAYAASAEIILGHHEYYDGSGKPRGLKGDALSIEAQILALSNEWDHLLYEHQLPKEEAIKNISNQAGKKYNPELVDRLKELMTY
ncbi:diguanylate cyclase domain-containing protein [Petrocella sp. FN5]|uniref:diguanylate cyclase domain-containing protein n=1 Tax=Petrocella sp. FN5 TaxID=3032002 RepID=UPI0023DC7332|nr:diguanylate cyclase [Petrocella sp. FN5]MDF1617999.1 diguanylate cyclase [Petrocella sp. FN5]